MNFCVSAIFARNAASVSASTSDSSSSRSASASDRSINSASASGEFSSRPWVASYRAQSFSIRARNPDVGSSCAAAKLPKNAAAASASDAINV
ncbi:MAG: hypothetical protein II655_00735 [Thermoguttaceae bacterium]|nr:hypothetical protein [Thermoguttaceae bacterium]